MESSSLPPRDKSDPDADSPSGSPQNPNETKWFRRQALFFKNTLFSLLKQGITPEKIAMAMLMGYIAGTFPIMGTHTLLGIFLAFSFRLNQLAVYLGLWIAFPFYLVMLLPSLRLGEYLFGADEMSADRFLDNMKLMWNSMDDFTRVLGEFGDTILHISVGWVPLVLVTAGPVFWVALKIAEKMIQRKNQ